MTTRILRGPLGFVLFVALIALVQSLIIWR
jgi:hypothetical protein